MKYLLTAMKKVIYLIQYMYIISTYRLAKLARLMLFNGDEHTYYV